jgi:hypothetical protein
MDADLGEGVGGVSDAGGKSGYSTGNDLECVFVGAPEIEDKIAVF